MIEKNGIAHIVLFHYVSKEDTAREIAKTGKMVPFGNYADAHTSFLGNPAYMRSRVNFTDVRPEEGRRAISDATFVSEGNINFGLELLVPLSPLEQRLPGLNRCYQIYTQNPVDIIVLRTWNMDVVEKRRVRGEKRIRRYTTERGMPHAYWETIKAA